MLSCRECGCGDARACVDVETGERCAWVEPDLCSFCAERLSATIDFLYEVYYVLPFVDDGVMVAG